MHLVKETASVWNFPISSHMEYYWNITWTFLLYSIITLTLAFLLHHLRRRHRQPLPPGPPGWLVFGHLFALGKMPHRSLAALQARYGPVVWLRLGSVNTVAILTASAAAKFFKNLDQSFTDRKVATIIASHGYDKGSLPLAPYGAYWRFLRRICTVEMLSVKKVNDTELIRRKCVDHMLTWLESEEARAVHVGRVAFLASFNVIGNLVLSRDMADPGLHGGIRSEFFEAVREFMKLTGEPNVADLFPWVGWVDPMGLRKKMDHRLGKVLGMVFGFVKERVEERRRGRRRERRNKDFLDVLLDFEGGDGVDKFSEEQISVFVLEMFLAGTDTSSNTTEWAMAELLRNPQTMINVKSELAKVVGPNKQMEERDIDNLPYLQAVVKETLRLHPPVPFLIPRKANHDTEFMGYHVPKNTQVFINAWAIGRDPECSDGPLHFKPERFLGSKVDYKGQHFELIPFGAGRRICAGVALGHRTLHLLLGSLVHEFDWEVVGGRERMDMRERMGAAVAKLEPLEAIPRNRMRQRHPN